MREAATWRQGLQTPLAVVQVLEPCPGLLVADVDADAVLAIMNGCDVTIVLGRWVWVCVCALL